MNFYYKGKDLQNNILKGYLEANNKKDVYEFLQKNNIFPFMVSRNFKINFIRKIKIKTLSRFINEWKNLENSGINSQTALLIIKNNEIDHNLKMILNNILLDMQKGIDMSVCFKKYDKYFPYIFLMHLEIGFKKSTIKETLELLDNYYQVQVNSKNKINSALIYPKILLTIFLIIFIVVCRFIIPVFKKMYSIGSINTNNLSFKLLNIFGFIGENIAWIILGVLSLILIFKMLKKINFFKKIKNRLKIILFKKYYKTYYTFLFIESLSLFWNNGFNKFESLKITKRIIPNYFYRLKISEVITMIESGKNLSESLRQVDLFDDAFIEMLGTSETNHFSQERIKNASIYYFKQYDNMINKIIKLIEPCVLVVMSFFVLVLILIIMFPMLNGFGMVM